MELSYFLAQLFGLSLAIFAAAVFHRPQMIRSLVAEIGQNQLVTLFAGFAGIMGGIAIILNHNVWVADWPVLITLFGWASVIKSVMYLMAPQILADLGAKVYNSKGSTQAVLLVAFAVGVYLAGAGFQWF